MMLVIVVEPITVRTTRSRRIRHRAGRIARTGVHRRQRDRRALEGEPSLRVALRVARRLARRRRRRRRGSSRPGRFFPGLEREGGVGDAWEYGPGRMGEDGDGALQMVAEMFADGGGADKAVAGLVADVFGCRRDVAWTCEAMGRFVWELPTQIGVFAVISRFGINEIINHAF